ncbi:MAG: acetoacetate--CoA ligase [Gemmatimonadetes bacterium]|nr:acetoacetate--CoA ligase [Gemmatimonadota bacterium]
MAAPDGETREPQLDHALWHPSPERVSRTAVLRFAREVQAAEGMGFVVDGALDYDALHRWSVEHPERFWRAVWRFSGVIADARPDGEAWETVLTGESRMAPPDPVLGPRWFAGARLNFAEQLLRRRDDGEALVAWNEEGRQGAMTFAELARQVQRAAGALRAQGVGPGDRVAAFLPNIPEAVIAMLAATSLGAIWSSCSPDFGVNGVLDRFGQIAPRVLVACDGYRYAGKSIDTRARVADIAAQIPGIERVVVVPYLREAEPMEGIRDACSWEGWLAAGDAWRASPAAVGVPDFTRLPFDHPLYIMYSSGTTGLPKCMVHGAGGTLLQHLKEHLLHTDLGPRDRVFYFTTCGWMMWNWLVSALAVGATVVLYDGAPMATAAPETGDRRRETRVAMRAGVDSLVSSRSLLWTMAERERLTVFGTSAKYLALAEKEGLAPGRDHDLSALRTILSTGSPLAPPSFDYVYRDIKADVQLSSISGGTDIISCFVLGNPAGPVWRGELQVAGLGMAVEIFGDDGRPVTSGPGELVCTRPFPSMPVAFWNDPDGAKYRAAYFDTYPGIWRHGDWIERTAHGGYVITGRSDATLNPGGVRIGTAEIYRQVEQLPEIVESLVVGQEIGSANDRDVRIVLFVRLREGVALDDALRQRIVRQVRANTSPHHVPKVIVAVPDIPRTISGKITELAVRDVIHGRPVKNTDALANPGALEHFRDRPELEV